MNSIALTNIYKNPHSPQSSAPVAEESVIDFGSLVSTIVSQSKQNGPVTPSNGFQEILAGLKNTILSLQEDDLSAGEELLAATEAFTDILAAFDNVFPVTVDSENNTVEVPSENFPAILNGLKNLLAAATGDPVVVNGQAISVNTNIIGLMGPQSPSNDPNSASPLQIVANTLAVLDSVISSSAGGQTLLKRSDETPNVLFNSQISDRLATPTEKSPSVVLAPLRWKGPGVLSEKKLSINPPIAVSVPVSDDNSLKSQSPPKLGLSGEIKTMRFDPRVHNLLSLIVKSTAGSNKLTGTATLAHQVISAGTEPATETNFSEFKLPAGPVSEQEIHNILRSAEKLGSISSKLPVENSQKNTFSQAVTRQIQSVNISQGRTVVQLAPNGLGNLEIDLQTDDAGSVHVIIRAENSSVLSALRNDRESVLAALSHVLPDSGASDLSFQNFGQDSKEREAQSDNGAFFDRAPSVQINNQTDNTRQPVISNDHLDLMA